MKADSILETIGATPHIRINRLFAGHDAEVWLKAERANPGGSIKDRIALAMVDDAERRGILERGRSTIVEPTSGNTGVGLAMVAAVRGYPMILVMPESMSLERRRLMAAYGARLELTPREGGMKAAIARAQELVDEIDGAWMPQQFENPANIEIHRDTTAAEILEDFPDGLDYLITGVGTGGHITGVSEVLKERFPDLTTLAVEPAKSPVIGGGEPSPHRIQGIGAGFIPGNLHRETLDGTIEVTEEEAFAYAVRAAREEGIFIGASSGASLAAVARKLPEMAPGSRVLTFCYDTGERYFSVEGLFSADGTDIQVGASPTSGAAPRGAVRQAPGMSVDPTGEDIKRLKAEDDGGPVVMLNLLRYAGEEGRASYGRYAAAITPFLEGVGGEVLYAGDVSTTLVAPEGHAWDAVLVVRYPSRDAFLQMVFDPAYQEITELRTQGLEAAVLEATRPWGA